MNHEVPTNTLKRKKLMSKKLLLTLLLLNSSLLAFSQGTWSPRSPLPSPDSAMVQGIPGFSIGNYGYAGLCDTHMAAVILHTRFLPI